MSSRQPSPLTVRGGAGHIDVDRAELRRLAREFGGVAEALGGAAWQLHAFLLEPAAILGAVLDPGGFASFEVILAAALDGPRGLVRLAVAVGETDLALQVSAVGYGESDSLHTWAHGLGALIVAAGECSTGHTAAAERELLDNPRSIDVVVAVAGLPSLAQDQRFLPQDGRGVLRHPGIDDSAVGHTPPRSVHDLVADLARRSDSRRHGQIDVRILTMPDGSRRAIVDISGTKSWDPFAHHDITTPITNLRALGGASTAYEQGVLAALHTAGVRRNDPVMIIGHSEGGMVAVNAARDAVRSGRFDVTHVITAGAPIGLAVGSLPTGVAVLALENSHDIVPHLDGVENPATRQVTTVSAAEGDGTVDGNHEVTMSYQPIADEIDASDDASIRHFERSAAGYFAASGVVTHTYAVQRA